MSKCERSEALRDYAFDELPAGERPDMEQHLAACAECATELGQLRLTTAALRALPDREIPQRIAFVSDKVFEPSPLARWFGGFWNSAARLGFASACVLAGALVFSAARRPVEIRQSPAPVAMASADVSAEIDRAVAKAVARVRAQVRAEDAKLTEAALASSDRKHAEEHKALMAAMEESIGVMQKRMGAYTSLASLDTSQSGAGQ